MGVQIKKKKGKEKRIHTMEKRRSRQKLSREGGRHQRFLTVRTVRLIDGGERRQAAQKTVKEKNNQEKVGALINSSGGVSEERGKEKGRPWRRGKRGDKVELAKGDLASACAQIDR